MIDGKNSLGRGKIPLQTQQTLPYSETTAKTVPVSIFVAVLLGVSESGSNEANSLSILLIDFGMGGKKKHEKRERNNSDEEPETAEQIAAKEETKAETAEEKFEPVAAKKVSYCPSTPPAIQSAAFPSNSANSERKRPSARPFCSSWPRRRSTSITPTSNPSNSNC